MDFTELEIASYRYWQLQLHENQCYLGRTLLFLKDQAGADDFLSICQEAREEFFFIGQQVKKALMVLFKPDKMNVAAQSNVCEKIHVHLIPRYRQARVFEGVNFQDLRFGQNYAPYSHDFSIGQHVLFKLKEVLQHQLACK